MKKIPVLISCLLALTIIIAALVGCAGSVNSSAPQRARAESTAPVAMAAPQMEGLAKSDYAVEGEAVYDRVDESADYEEEPMDYEEAIPESPATGGGDTGGIAGPAVKPVVDSRKIIKNVDMQLQTISFDSGVDSINTIAESFGGYVQDSYITGRDMYNERGARYASFTVRIPSEKLDSFVNSLGGEFNVLSKSQNSQDITDVYFDSKARLDALKVQEDRLTAMLEKAEELEYLLQVEKELMNVRYELESLTSSLARMDSYVSLSTVTIQLSEVVKYDQLEDIHISFGERITRAFSGSWVAFSDFMQNSAVFLIAVLPFILLIAVIALIIAIVIRRGRKRAPKKGKASEQAPPSSPTDGEDNK